MNHSGASEDDCTPRASTFAVGSGLPNPSPIIDLTLASCTDDSSPTPPVSPLSNSVNVARLFPPFEGCDLVLRTIKSAPHVEFYVDRETIYSRSSYLKYKISALGPVPAGIDVIYWVDEADTLDAMLRFVYPDRPKPKVESVSHLRFLLGTAQKYGIAAAMHTLGTAMLFDFAPRDPLSAFAVACEFGLADKAVLISKETLKVDIMTDEKSSVLNRVSLSYYHRLTRLRRFRAAKAMDIISLIDAEHPMNEFDPPYCKGCGTNATWWQVFVRYGSIELKRRPVTDKVFSPAFLAKCVRTSHRICRECIDSYMHTYSQKLLARLKKDIDSLPVYIS